MKINEFQHFVTVPFWTNTIEVYNYRIMAVQNLHLLVMWLIYMTSVYLCFMMSLILQQITNDSVKILANLAIFMHHCKDILVVMIIIRRLICAYDIEYHEWH